jgi:Ras-related protein Rab-8A
MGIIMVYAINDRASFNALENWMKQIKTHAAENVVKVLIANKADAPERQVSYEEGKKIADSFGINFFEVSAKNNTNISEMFTYMAK